MSKKWKVYPAYKDSGVAAIGAIPASWEMRRAKSLEKNAAYLAQTGPFGAQLHASEYLRDGQHGVPLILIKHVNDLKIAHEDLPLISEDKASQLTEYRVEPGDIVFSRVGSVGRIGLVTQHEAGWMISGQMLRLRFRNPHLDRSFALYAISSQPVLGYFDLMTVGTTRDSINTAILRGMPLPLPPLHEQRAIAAFLDRETVKIDALVAKKERLIELLQEKRAALITHTVTKGLDPGVPMKDSGIDWLGEIPTHWEVAPIYAKYEVALGKMLDAKRITGTYLAPYLRNVDVQWDRANTSDLPEMDFAPGERSRFSLRPGDLLVCEGGEVGRTAIWRGELAECYYQKAIHRLRPHRGSEHPRFFLFLMFAAAHLGVFVADANPNTIDHLTAVKLRHHRFPFPPVNEQLAMASFLDNETKKIDATINEVRKGVQRLTEYRTALISAAVTGKIDVRSRPTGVNDVETVPGLS